MVCGLFTEGHFVRSFILFINPHQESGSQFRKKSTILKTVWIKWPTQAVPLTCSQNVAQHLEKKLLKI